MGRLLLALLVGVVGALIVHIGVILWMPGVAEDNVWARLVRSMPAFQPTVVSAGGNAAPIRTAPAAPEGEAPVPDGSGSFGFVDPAFMIAACRFTVADAPVRLSAGDGAGFWSASINARSGDNLYSINERLALGSRFDLVVGTEEQLDVARIEGRLVDEESIPVTVATTELYLTLRALVESESERPFVDRFVRSLRCEPIELPEAAALGGSSAG